MTVELTPITREEWFLDQIAKNGGGGSALPSYTSSDVGKVLTVGEGQGGDTETVTIISEQTVNILEGEIAASVNATSDISRLQVGDSVTIVVNGVTYTEVADSIHDTIVVPVGENYDISVFTDSCAFSAPVGSYTISATAEIRTQVVAPVWQTVEEVVEIETPFTTPTPTGITVEELYNSALNGSRPVLVANIDDTDHKYFYPTDIALGEVVWANIFATIGTTSSVNIGILAITPGKGGVYNMTYHNLSTPLSAT